MVLGMSRRVRRLLMLGRSMLVVLSSLKRRGLILLVGLLGDVLGCLRMVTSWNPWVRSHLVIVIYSMTLSKMSCPNYWTFSRSFLEKTSAWVSVLML